MPYTAWTFGSIQLACTEHQQFLAESMQPFSTTTNSIYWFMPDEMFLARIMTALDLEFKMALHYHDEGYESDKDYRLPTQVMRPLHVYSVLTTEASFIPTDYKGAQCFIPPYMPRQHRDELPFCQGVCQCLTFDETPQKKWILTMRNISHSWPWWPGMVWGTCTWQLGIPMHSPDSRPAIPTPLPYQVEMPPEPEQMDTEIPEDLPDLIDVLKELLSDIDSWAHSLLQNQG